MQRGWQARHRVLPWGLLSGAKGQRLGFLPAPARVMFYLAWIPSLRRNFEGENAPHV